MDGKKFARVEKIRGNIAGGSCLGLLVGWGGGGKGGMMSSNVIWGSLTTGVARC